MPRDIPHNIKAPLDSAIAPDAPVTRLPGYPDLTQATDYTLLIVGGTVVARPIADQPSPPPSLET